MPKVYIYPQYLNSIRLSKDMLNNQITFRLKQLSFIQQLSLLYREPLEIPANTDKNGNHR